MRDDIQPRSQGRRPHRSSTINQVTYSERRTLANEQQTTSAGPVTQEPRQTEEGRMRVSGVCSSSSSGDVAYRPTARTARACGAAASITCQLLFSPWVREPWDEKQVRRLHSTRAKKRPTTAEKRNCTGWHTEQDA